ncbi:MAG TPA: Asp-tRNA(Asn)/Glu-tRNA(Gln) amidotransferase subunit GatA, partial [Candidatus Peregrinibacteria bacterium]|nr:Asp-tRNA(Asn)/Glu-tRNA(Gln) amidotransferase subunit GatA [Candidatus Peregrinibacteria bacterium]
MTLLSNLTIAEAGKKLQNKEINAVELTEAVLKQIEKINPQLNAYINITKKNALQQAHAADERIKSGRATPLTGIPIALKDVFCEKDVETTACSKILKGFKPPYDATVVRKLREENCVFVGHANTDEFTMGASTETSCFGVTKNPWDQERVAGGSSGGSAAAVAANLCLGATGTDTGGSIRQPAAFCGCTGLKVTYGRVSRSGIMSMASSLDTIGSFAKTAEDLALLLNVIAGKDVLDSTTPDQAVPDYTQALGKNLKGLKVGIPQEYFIEGIDPEVEKPVREAIETIKKLGAEIKEVSLPHTKYAIATYYIICPAEVSSNMSRYDGIRFGPKAEKAENLRDFYESTKSAGFGDEVKRRIMIGTYTLSAGYYNAYYLKAQKVRTLIKRDFEKVFEKVDIL